MENEHSSLMAITQRPPMIMTQGQGSWLMDEHGRAYLDFMQGWAVNTLGHAAGPVVTALSTQAAQLLHCSPAFYNAPMLQLAGRLTRLSGLDQACFLNSGAEANETALKLARKWGAPQGRHRLITTGNSFHGRTLAMMSASGKPHWEPLFEPKVPGFDKVPFNDLAAVRAAIRPDTVAILVEPIQGEGGVMVPDDDYLPGLRALADEHGLLLILDEVQTGIGRTGSLFAFEQAGIRPDIVTLAKGLGAGVPLAAVLAQNHCCCFETGDHGSTWGGNPLMCAVGNAVLDIVSEPTFLASVRQAGQQLACALQRLSAHFALGDIRGRGLLWALEIPAGNAPAIVESARTHGLLINAPRATCLRFMPALNVTADEIACMAERLALAMAEVYETQRAFFADLPN